MTNDLSHAYYFWTFLRAYNLSEGQVRMRGEKKNEFVPQQLSLFPRKKDGKRKKCEMTCLEMRRTRRKGFKMSHKGLFTA